MWFEITYISCGAIFLIYLCNRFKIDLKANADSIIYFLVPAFFLIIYDDIAILRQETGSAFESGFKTDEFCCKGRVLLIAFSVSDKKLCTSSSS